METAPTHGEHRPDRRRQEQLTACGWLSIAIVVVALTLSPRRHFGRRCLQLGAGILPWLLGPFWLRLRRGGLLLAPQAGKVRSCRKGDVVIVGQPLRQIHAIGDTTPCSVTRLATRLSWPRTVPVISSPARAVRTLCCKGCSPHSSKSAKADRMASWRFGLVASSMTCFIAGLDGSFVVSIDASIIRDLLMTVKSTS